MGIDERVRKVAFKIVYALLCTSFLLFGCEQQTEGCLDYRALVVTVDADDACTDCCVFPSLELQLIPIRFNVGVDPKVLRSSDTLINGGLLGILPELGFYLFDIALIAEDGTRLEMRDTFTVFTDGVEPSFLYESSVLRVQPFRQTSYELGTLLEQQIFVAVEAKLGLPDVLSAANPDFQISDSPLYRDLDSLLVSSVDDTYLDLAFKYEKLDGTRDSIQSADAQDQTIRWELPGPIVYEPSYNLQIALGLPVDRLLEFNNGTVNGEVFVRDFLVQAQVIEITLSR